MTDEIKTKLSHLRKTYSNVNNDNLTTIDDDNDIKPIFITHEHSVQVISTLT